MAIGFIAQDYLMTAVGFVTIGALPICLLVMWLFSHCAQQWWCCLIMWCELDDSPNLTHLNDCGDVELDGKDPHFEGTHWLFWASYSTLIPFLAIMGWSHLDLAG
jgi:hypothetical protein